MQRRDFIQSIGISGGLSVLGPAMSGLAMEALAQPAAPARTAIEPITIRRRGLGLRGYDPDHAFRGFTLFCLPLYGCGNRQGVGGDITPTRRKRQHLARVS